MPLNDPQRLAPALELMVTQPQSRLDKIAASLGLNSAQIEDAFHYWLSISTAEFLQALAAVQTTSLLTTASIGTPADDSTAPATVLEVLTRPPTEPLNYGIAPTPFGALLAVGNSHGIVQANLLDSADNSTMMSMLTQRWPQVPLRHTPSLAQHLAKAMLQPTSNPAEVLSLSVSGTPFQVAVWRALLHITTGHLSSYSRLAQGLGRPRSYRALANAVGANPVAFFIPCHRVIRQSGALGGYRWGSWRKLALQAWEQARSSSP